MKNEIAWLKIVWLCCRTAAASAKKFRIAGNFQSAVHARRRSSRAPILFRHALTNLELSVLAICSLMFLESTLMASESGTNQLLAKSTSATAVQMFPLSNVRLLPGPFSAAVAANRTYLLALEPDRLLAPFLREAGIAPRQRPYGNWESSGLGGHTAGHYLSALANMIASGDDTPNGDLQSRLNYMVAELDRCQQTNGDGYVGGVPGGSKLWKDVAEGKINADGFGINGKWVPWYNVHKTFAGLRDAFLVASNAEARAVLVKLGDWCYNETSGLTDEQMQNMLKTEQGGMCEVLADIYAITGDEKYLKLSRRFIHHAVMDPLMKREDQLTGLHANTQIPKVIGLERLAALTGDPDADAGARFFWEDVTKKRSVAFGGNSVSEHFNDPKDFSGMIQHREGPETCNTYNMLRLTEQLFSSKPAAEYADYYERALYNHILSTINPAHPGYVYFTPIRPDHYRVYSQPDDCFWCCVGTGMENPGKYGEFIYARAKDGIYVNLFIASEVTAGELGLTLRQETAFPDEPRTRLTVKLEHPSTFTLHLRHPVWVSGSDFKIRVNGKSEPVSSAPTSYAEIRREWKDGDRVEIELPMRTTVERLPDGSDWIAILHGPIVLAAPDGTNDMIGLFANAGRMAHVASGPMVPLDKVPVLMSSATQVPAHVIPDSAAGPLHFKLMNIVEPPASNGLSLIPFFRLHEERYQMYWQLMTRDSLEARRGRLVAEERARAAREAATLDFVAIGEQQSEVEHQYSGNNSQSGMTEGRRWRDGHSFQYTLNAGDAKAADLAVGYWGSDNGRTFDIFANDVLVTTETLNRSKPGQFFEKRYPLPPAVFAAANDGRVTIKFAAKSGSAGGIFDLRLMLPENAAPSAQ